MTLVSGPAIGEVHQSFNATREILERTFPHYWQSVEAGLATCATLLLADNVNPVALILVGPSSAGKTTIVNMFDGAVVNGEPLCYRSDKFTPAAFVSQSAQVTEARLKQVDLLPRIRHKVLLTPEMAIVFRGKRDELIERFSTITRVLDGQGLMTDSGTHGRRGYEGDYVFAWIGCTTPFDPLVWEVMAQLGSRLFFIVLQAGSSTTLAELQASLTQSASYKENLADGRKAVHVHLEAVFKHFGGVRGVIWSPDGNPPEVTKAIAQCATLLALLRTPVEHRDDVLPPLPESPQRANSVLYNLARGHALISGRTYLTEEDLPMIMRVTLSSIPRERRAVLQAFVQNDGEPLTVKQVEQAGGVSRHTAERIMEDMHKLGIATYEKNGVGKASRLCVSPGWEWAVKDPFATSILA